jgi:histidyl-tRNA synthetase
LLLQINSRPVNSPDLYIVSRGEAAETQGLLLAQKLRSLDLSVELDLSGSAFGKQFKRADRSGAVACLIIGDAEAANHTVNLKWLASGEQKAIAQGDLLNMTDELKAKITELRSS